MPMNRKLYPKDWEAIALEIKQAANWTCEFCGKPCRPPEISLNQTGEWLEENYPEWLHHLTDEIEDDEHGVIDLEKPQRFTLTTAHLDHNPANCEVHNLKALCSVCHCRYDSEHHKQSRRKNKLKAREQAGQLTFDLGI
jgi:hypothetical protein